MLTVKLYRNGKTRIYEAGSVTVLRGFNDFTDHELTLHDVPGREDFRVDITLREEPPTDAPITYWDSAVIENANGSTSEIIRAQPAGVTSLAA